VSTSDKVVLITGASGFLGASLARAFQREAWTVRGSSRRVDHHWPPGVVGHSVVDGRSPEDWHPAVMGADVVIHCAARVHVMQEHEPDPLTAFRSANVDVTMALARAASAAGVGRFVFISTIGVHGADSGQRPFRPDDIPAPHSPYAQSKLEAERAIEQWGRQRGLEVVIVRPPLIYGPGAPGNFGRLVAILKRGLPLPLGAVNNLRSLISVGNLSSLIMRCAAHPAAAGQTILASDGEDLSTTQLLRVLGDAMHRPARLLPVPPSWLAAALRLAGREGLAQQLMGTLQVDLAETRRLLEWEPPEAATTALSRSVASVSD
jgi:UDP-4-keto-D-QuiNAc 4-reductase